MNSSNSRRHKWVRVGVGVAPQSQDLVAERLCCCFVLLIENVLSGNTVLWWLGHCVLWHVSTLNVLLKERFIFRRPLFMGHLYHLRGGGLHMGGRTLTQWPELSDERCRVWTVGLAFCICEIWLCTTLLERWMFWDECACVTCVPQMVKVA